MSDIKIIKDPHFVQIVKDLSIEVGLDGTGIIITLNRHNCFGQIVYISKENNEASVDFGVMMGETSVQINGVLVGLDDIEFVQGNVGETGFGSRRVKKARRHILS